MEKRESFKSSFGLFAAAVGSAVGLGNIWRFPYIAGMNGGAAFILIYLICVAIIGLPVLLSEFIVGRKGKSNPIHSFKNLAPGERWYISGILGVMAAFLILSFYSVIAGWTLEYLVKAIGNQFVGKDVSEIGAMFESFISDPARPIFMQFIILCITYYIVANGIEKGIEKYSSLLVPVLIVIIIILDIRAITLPGAVEGIKFLFKPDFSKLNGKTILDALGHSFFSLSLGAGTMIAYGSYIGKEQKLGISALNIALADTLIAILAGLAIFPVVFAFGIAPDSGPGLVFVTLPNVFPQIPGGYVFQVLFFLLLALAAITSTISMLESVVCFGMDKFNMGRKKTALIAALLVFIVSIFASLSNGPLNYPILFGSNFLDFLDKLTANYFMTTGSLITVLFVGWRLDRKIIEEQLTNRGIVKAGYMGTYQFVARYISPLAIIIVFLASVGLIGK